MKSVTQEAIPYVTLMLRNAHGETISGAFSDTLGNYTLGVARPGSYSIRASSLGHHTDSISFTVEEPHTTVPAFHLAEDTHLLNAVTITAKNLMIREESDRIIYNVEKDPDAKRMKIAEIITKIPQLRYNKLLGKLEYGGPKSTYVILLDGQRNTLIDNSRQYTMQLIKADVVKDIVILFPGEKFGYPHIDYVIDITLRKQIPAGYGAKIMLYGNTQGAGKGDIDLVTKIDKLILAFKYGLSGRSTPTLTNRSLRENLLSEENRTLKTESKSNSNSLQHQLECTSFIPVTKKSTLTAIVSLKAGHSSSRMDSYSNFSNAVGVPVSTQYSRSRGDNDTKPRVGGILNYSYRLPSNSQLSLAYGLTNDAYCSENLLTNTVNPGEQINRQRSRNESSSQDHATGLTFEKKFKKNRNMFRLTAGYTHRTYNNMSELTRQDDPAAPETYVPFLLNGLHYTQQIGKLQTRFNWQVSQVFNLNFILGAEQMGNQGTFQINATQKSKLDYNEFNLLPAFRLTYFQKKHSIRYTLGYSTRLLRPNITYLNPFVNDADPLNISYGNPHLKAEYGHLIRASISTGALKIVSLNCDAMAEFINNAIENITTVNDQNISTTTFENIGQRNNYTVNLSVNYSKPRIFVSFYGSYICNTFRNKMTREQNTKSGYGGNLHGNLYLGKKKNTSISAEIKISPIMGNAQTQKVHYESSYLFSIYQNVLKNLSIGATIENPFENRRFLKNELGDQTYRMIRETERLGRLISFRLTWSFGRFKERIQNEGITPAADLHRQTGTNLSE